jgi:hypothetical protein
VRGFELPLIGCSAGELDELAGLLFRDDLYAADAAGFVEF